MCVLQRARRTTCRPPMHAPKAGRLLLRVRSGSRPIIIFLRVAKRAEFVSGAFEWKPNASTPRKLWRGAGSYLIQIVNGACVTRYPRKVTNIAQPSFSAHNSTLSASLRPPHPGQPPNFKSSVIPNQRHLRHRIIRPPLGSCSTSHSGS